MSREISSDAQQGVQSYCPAVELRGPGFTMDHENTVDIHGKSNTSYT